MKLDPPLLMRSQLSGKVYVVTHGKLVSHGDPSRPVVEASVKYDVTDQFDALTKAKA